METKVNSSKGVRGFYRFLSTMLILTEAALFYLAHSAGRMDWSFSILAVIALVGVLSLLPFFVSWFMIPLYEKVKFEKGRLLLYYPGSKIPRVVYYDNFIPSWTQNGIESIYGVHTLKLTLKKEFSKDVKINLGALKNQEEIEEMVCKIRK